MRTEIPQPPTGLEMPGDAELAFSVLGGLLLVTAVVVGLRYLAGRGDPVLLLCLVGGALAAFLEPFIGILGLMYIPEDGASTAFEFFDRGMPVFVVTSYAGYIGGLTYLAFRYLQLGLNPGRVLRLWAVFAVANVAFETPAVLLDVYTYYGNQPLNPWGFPLWWAFVNPLSSILAGALLVRLREPLAQRRALAAVPLLVPMSAGAANGMTAVPMWLTLSDTGIAEVWTWAAAGATLFLALFTVWLIGTLLGDGRESGAARSAPAPRSEPRPARETSGQGAR